MIKVLLKQKHLQIYKLSYASCKIIFLQKLVNLTTKNWIHVPQAFQNTFVPHDFKSCNFIINFDERPSHTHKSFHSPQNTTLDYKHIKHSQSYKYSARPMCLTISPHINIEIYELILKKFLFKQTKSIISQLYLIYNESKCKK